MATVSKNVDTTRKSSTISEPSSSEVPSHYFDTPKQYVVIGNLHGIKSTQIWPRLDKRDISCFILPLQSTDPDPISLNEYIFRGVIEEFPEKEFIRFWLELDDDHKERRLLLDYFCLIRDVDDFIKRTLKKMILHEENLLAPPLHPPEYYKQRLDEEFQLFATNPVKKIVQQFMSDLLRILRRLFIEEQRKGGTGGFPTVVHLFTKTFLRSSSPEKDKCIRTFFRRVIITTTNRLNVVVEDSLLKSRALIICQWLMESVVDAVFNTFVAMKVVGDKRKEKGRRKYLGKLGAAAVHWRSEDRVYLLKAIETKGESCRGTYVESLIKNLGLDRFKIIAFGKEKFCSKCGRSSNVGDRMLCCWRCVDEHIRPKARYCNVECQRSDWLKHKSIFHANKNE